MPLFHTRGKTIGTCTCCGAEDVEITLVYEDEEVCDECLDREYFYCDACEEYWSYDAIDFFNLKDGRTICEHCAEDFDEDEFEE